jgi:ribosomal protein S12 methylthiotransferase accessory factor
MSCGAWPQSAVNRSKALEPEQNPLAGPLKAAANILSARGPVVNADSAEARLLRHLGYDDGDVAQAANRARLLHAAARLRRIFLLAVPDAPGLTFFGGEADPATFDKSYEGLPTGSLAGSGLTPQRAFESCVGEGVEYLSQFLRADDAIESATPNVHHEIPDPHVKRFVAVTLADAAVDANRPIGWVSADRLPDGERVRFPLDLCYRRRPAEQDFVPPLKLSSGCAAGTSVEAATLRALLELIERDAVALWWRGGRRGRAIAPDGEAAATANALLAQVRQGKADRTSWLLDITTDVEIPVVAALSANADGFGFAFGFGARLTLADAARAAIFELCQVEFGQHIIAAKRRDSGDGALNENDRRQSRRVTDFDARGCRLLQPRPEPAEGRHGPASTLRDALGRLEARGIAAYRINLTRPELGIPVVRVLAPGLQLEPCRIVGPRLAAMIGTTGGGAAHHGGMPLL